MTQVSLSEELKELKNRLYIRKPLDGIMQF